MALSTALIAGGIASTAAAAMNGVASFSQAKAQEAADEFDAGMAEQNARTTRQETATAEEQQRRRSRLTLSAQRSTAAARGLDLAGSSAWDLYRQSAIDAEADALELRRKGESQARGLDARAAGSKFAAKQARTAGRIGIGASLLSTGAAAADGAGDFRLLTAGRS